jgi:hypothetical protein
MFVYFVVLIMLLDYISTLIYKSLKQKKGHPKMTFSYKLF